MFLNQVYLYNNRCYHIKNILKNDKMTLWKQMTWKMFHEISFHYHPEYRDRYIDFFDTMRTIIPCKICRDHYQFQLESMRMDDNINQERIFDWTIDLHNHVNEMHHKKKWSYEESRNTYRHSMKKKWVKYFIYEYIRTNFKKGHHKTEQLLRMLRSFCYIYNPKRNELIDFERRFYLDGRNMKSWLYTFIHIISA